MLEQIKKVRDEIARIEKLNCTCGSFALQYNQGCDCKKGQALEVAEKRLNNLIESI